MLMNRTKPGTRALLLALGEEDGARAVRLGTVLLAAVLAAALAFRLVLAWATDFPIGDGALFYDFVRAIARTFPALPATVLYNGIDIPLAYPPLSFWIAAGFARAGVDPLAIVHWAPIAMNAAYVLLFAALLLRHGHSRLFTALAVLFAFTALRSFEWLVMGGGLSRSLGSLFFLLALLAAGLPRRWAERSDDGPSWTRLALAGLSIGLAILSHLEWGILAAACFVANRALSVRTPASFVLDNLVAGGTALLVVLPWALLMIQTHGLGPFLSAGASSDWSLKVAGLKVLGTVLRNSTNIFMLLGIAVLVARRDWFWLIFVPLCMLLTPRSGDTPAVLAVGVVAAHGVLALAKLLERIDLGTKRAAGLTAILVALLVGWQIERDSDMFGLSRPLSPEKLEAMRWVRVHHPGRDFAIVSQRHWAYDLSGEWFPTLAGARSITTVQGREWLPDENYKRWYDMNIKALEAKTCPDLLKAVRAFGKAEFVWVESRRSCFSLPLHRPVFRNADVTIFKVEGGRP
jgi:hypothetical protein